MSSDCPVCLESMSDSGRDGGRCAWISPCGHQFCISCVSQWLRENEGCPLCRVRAIIYDTRTTVYPIIHPETPSTQPDLIEEVPAGVIISIIGHYGRGRNTRYAVVRTDRRITFELGSALAVNYRALLQEYRARIRNQ